MPPPPPPSASYLLVLDTSSEEEEGEENNEQTLNPRFQMGTPAKNREPTSVPESVENEPTVHQQENVETEAVVVQGSKPGEELLVPEAVEAAESKEECCKSEEAIKEERAVLSNDEDTISSTASKKKKKKKKRKNKRRKKKTKGVNFGSVAIREHGRCLGTDVVPLDGGWPLGLSNEVVSEVELPVEDFEQERQAELKERWISKFGSDDNSSDKDTEEINLETRQYDYKKKVRGQPDSNKNPLFGVMTEQDRMKLLLRDSSTEEELANHAATTSVPSSPQSKKHTYKTRSSVRARSSSNADKYEYNDTYPSTEVKHVRNELEQIRIHRGLEHVGCSCHKTKNNSHKRHHHRLTERKAKEELRKRGLLPKESKSKNELEAILKEAMEKEPCCWGDDCPCVRSGIGCHADVCLCWRSEPPLKTIEAFEQQCGNKHGIYVVNVAEIDAARQPYYCQPTTTTKTQE